MSAAHKYEESKVSEKPEKVWLVFGQHPARNLKDYPYITDPRHYELPGMKPLTDEEYSASFGQIKAFIQKTDAIDFCYECGLEVTLVFGYRLAGDKYVKDDKIADEVLDIDW